MATKKRISAEKNENKERVFRKGDIFILLALIVAVVLTAVFATRNTATAAEIYIDGQLKYNVDLSVDNEIEILDGKMTVSIKDGKISVLESDCAEQLCVSSKWISIEGGMIVCLPNRVVIKVTTKEVDAIT